MLDPRLLRNELETTAAQLARRGLRLDVENIAALEGRRKALQVAAQELQNERNSRSKGIGWAKAAGEDIQPLLDEVADLGERLKGTQEELSQVQADLGEIVMGFPTRASRTAAMRPTTVRSGAGVNRRTSISRSRIMWTSEPPSAAWTSKPPPS